MALLRNGLGVGKGKEEGKGRRRGKIFSSLSITFLIRSAAPQIAVACKIEQTAKEREWHRLAATLGSVWEITA